MYISVQITKEKLKYLNEMQCDVMYVLRTYIYFFLIMWLFKKHAIIYIDSNNS